MGAENGNEYLRLAYLAGSEDRRWRSSRRNNPRRPCRRRRDPAWVKAAARTRARDPRSGCSRSRRMNGAILFPQNEKGDARLHELDDKIGSARFRAPPHALLGPMLAPRHRRSVRPAAGMLGPPPSLLQIALNDAAARHPERPRDVPGAGPVPGKPERLSKLSHGHLPLCRHCALLVQDKERMPQLLTQVVLFRPRKVGGLLIGIRAPSGMVAAFKSEYPAGLIRNPHSTFGKSFETEI